MGFGVSFLAPTLCVEREATMNNENYIGRKQSHWVLIQREIASISQEPTGFASQQANLVSGDKERSVSH